MFHPINPDRPGMTLIHRSAGLMQAEVIKGRLETAGIPVMFDYESLGRVMGITIDGLGEVRIFVPDQFAQAARELLEPREGDEADTDEQETI
jgi:hypothetical protein